METQSKQRIVGVVVLLILVAAIVALLFYGAKQNESLDSGKKSQVDANKTEVQLTLPVDGQSQTASITGIDATPRGTVPANRAAPVNEQAGSDATQSPSATDMVANDGKVDNSAPAIAPATMPVTQPAAIVSNNVVPKTAAAVPANQTAPTAEASTEEVSPTATDKESTDADVVAPAVTPTKAKNIKKVVVKNKNIATVKYASRGTWAVRTGCFIAPPNADNMTKKLRSHGYKTYRSLLVTNKGVLSQVFVGPVQNRAEAMALSRDLQKKLQIRGIVMNTAAKATSVQGKVKAKKTKHKTEKTRVRAVQQTQAQ